LPDEAKAALYAPEQVTAFDGSPELLPPVKTALKELGENEIPVVPPERLTVDGVRATPFTVGVPVSAGEASGAAPRFVSAPAAVLAPVPPIVTGTLLTVTAWPEEFVPRRGADVGSDAAPDCATHVFDAGTHTYPAVEQPLCVVIRLATAEEVVGTEL